MFLFYIVLKGELSLDLQYWKNFLRESLAMETWHCSSCNTIKCFIKADRGGSFSSPLSFYQPVVQVSICFYFILCASMCSSSNVQHIASTVMLYFKTYAYSFVSFKRFFLMAVFEAYDSILCWYFSFVHGNMII